MRRPRVDRARELFSAGCRSLGSIKRAIAEEFSVSLDSAHTDVADMIREMAAEQFELRPHYKTLAIARCESVYEAAMRDGKYAAALRALELHAKITGVLEAQPADGQQRPQLDFSRLTPEQRLQFRAHLDLVAQAQLDRDRERSSASVRPAQPEAPQA